MAERAPGQSSKTSLHGKVALVTGSARGIGRAIAVALAADGADVIVNDLVASGESTETLRQIERHGRRGIVVGADVSKPGEVDALVGAAMAEFGRIDILVNNACRGVGDDRWSPFKQNPETTVGDMPLEWWHVTLDNCLSSAFYCSRAVVPHMIRAGRGGRIINIGSIHGLVTFPKFSPYQVAKAGMLMVTKGLAVELAPWKINVNGIAPGAIATEPASRPMAQDAVEAYRRRIPLGVRGVPEDVAGVAAFLASDAARYMTGQMLYVDGGYVIDGSLPEFKPYFHPVQLDDPDGPIE